MSLGVSQSHLDSVNDLMPLIHNKQAFQLHAVFQVFGKKTCFSDADTDDREDSKGIHHRARKIMNLVAHRAVLGRHRCRWCKLMFLMAGLGLG